MAVAWPITISHWQSESERRFLRDGHWIAEPGAGASRAELLGLALGFLACSHQLPGRSAGSIYMLSQVPIRVSRTQTGMEVSFGELEFLANTPKPGVRAFEQPVLHLSLGLVGKTSAQRDSGRRTRANPQGGANGWQTERGGAASVAARFWTFYKRTGSRILWRNSAGTAFQ